MKNIQLHRGHAVQIAFHYCDGHPVACDIQHESTPGEARLIFDLHGRNSPPVRTRANQLQERLQSAENACNRMRLEPCRSAGDLEFVGFVVAEGGVIAAAFPAVDHQSGLAWLDQRLTCLSLYAREESLDGGVDARV